MPHQMPHVMVDFRSARAGGKRMERPSTSVSNTPLPLRAAQYVRKSTEHQQLARMKIGTQGARSRRLCAWATTATGRRAQSSGQEAGPEPCLYQGVLGDHEVESLLQFFGQSSVLTQRAHVPLFLRDTQ